jgi:transposase-like protein
VEKSYKVVSKEDRAELAKFLAKDGQHLLPLVGLVEQSRLAVDELVDVMGQAVIEAVLSLSAISVAGERHQGKAGGEVRRHGHQRGVVRLSERKLQVERPRLRRKGGGEEEVPAYEAMNGSDRLGARMLEILMRGVSTRNYARVLPKMAATVGVSKSAVSREYVEASAEELRRLAERDFKGVDFLALYLDGLRFAKHLVVVAVGVDTEGKKHVLGLVEGSTESATVCKSLLTGLVSRGISFEGKRYLFVIDGSKALRQAIDEVCGQGNPVQRCRNHKIDNVCGYLPKDLKPQIKTVMKAAYQLGPEEGMKKLKTQAQWLQSEYPSAAQSLLEGLEETFTINRLNLSPSLRRCLGTTNLIENPNSAARRRTGRVSRWRDGEMVLRWSATAFLDAEQSFRKIMGHKDLWLLETALDRKSAKTLDQKQKTG